MKIDTIIHDHLYVIGLPTEILVPIQRDLEKWLECNGIEWVCERIKKLKALFLQYASHTTYLKTDRTIKMRGGIPIGSFRPLFKMAHGPDFKKALRVLQLHGLFVLKEVTKTQWEKFITSVEEPMKVIDHLPNLEIEPEYKYLARSEWSNSGYTPLSSWIGEDLGTRAPIYGKDGQFWNLGNVPMSSTSVVDHLRLLSRYLPQSLIQAYPLPFKAIGIELKLEPKDVYFVQGLRDGSIPFPRGFGGTIGVIQERGAKLRAVANPFRVYQACLSRLGTCLFRLMESFPWDCTFNQNRGIEWTQARLKEGATIHSIDLSDATNQFPLALQLQVMLTLFTPEEKSKPTHDGMEGDGSICESRPLDISAEALEIIRWGGNVSELTELRQSLDIFAKLAHHSLWKLPKSVRHLTDKQDIKWVKGQPLGLYPSFAIFAVSHGLLLRSIERDLGLVNTFRILGDDVVISDDKVQFAYRCLLGRLGCPVSSQKTLDSKEIGEFAGRVITKEGAIVAEKWKLFHYDDPIAPLRMFGIQGIKLVPKIARAAIQWLASLPEPVGLGLNELGLSVGKRTEGVIDLYEEKVKFPHVPSKDRTLEIKARLSDAFSIHVEDYEAHPSRHTNLFLDYLKETGYGVSSDLLGGIEANSLISRRLGEHLQAVLKLENLDYRLPPDVSYLLAMFDKMRVPRGTSPFQRLKTWLGTINRWFRKHVKSVLHG